MRKKIKREELKSIILGACFMGSGGGGGLEMAMEILSQIRTRRIGFEKITDLNPKSDEYQTVIAGVGSPDAGDSGELDLSQFNNAYLAINKCNPDKKIHALTPVELGAANSIIPFYVASLNRRTYVLDADTAGRAVPELPMTLLNMNNVSIAPLYLSANNSSSENKNGLGPAFNFSVINIEKAAEAESFVRSAIGTSMFNEIGGLALYPCPIQQIQDTPGALNQNSISLCAKIGEEFLKLNGIDETIKTIGDILKTEANRQLYSICSGTISEYTSTSSGFDVGTLEIIDQDGNYYWVHSQNENLLLWDCKNEQALTMAPDSICFMIETEEGKVFPISNAELMSDLNLKSLYGRHLQSVKIEKGTKIHVFAISAVEGMRSQRMLNIFLQILDEIKPIQHYQPVEELIQQSKELLTV